MLDSVRKELRRINRKLVTHADEMGLPREAIENYGSAPFELLVQKAAQEFISDGGSDVGHEVREPTERLAAINPERIIAVHLRPHLAKGEPESVLLPLSGGLVACTYGLDAVDRGNAEDAVSWLVLACSMEATVLAFRLGPSEEAIAQQFRALLSERGKQAAKESHREHHAMRAQVFEWCDENMGRYPSMDSAAESVARKLVPASVRTVRKWIGSWPGIPAWRAQKRRSARKA